MNIKEITIENFRSYYGKNNIKFKDGLVLFVGDNGDGKTTFFEALEWLFDTSTQYKDFSLISKKKLSEMPLGGSETLSVSMTFEHDGEKIVKKSFSFRKNSDTDIKTEDFQYKGLESNGIERHPIHGGILLDRCFEAAIRKYCLFKGEENLNVFNNTDALKYLIETFSNIREFDPFYTGKEDNMGFLDLAEDLSRKAYEKAMKSEKKNVQKERELSSKLERLRGELSNVRKRLETNRTNANSYSEKLNNIENSKEASSLLKDINERLKSLKEKKRNLEVLINEDYTIKLLDEMWILHGFTPILNEYHEKINSFSKQKRQKEDEDKKQKGKKEAYDEISSSLAKGIIPLSVYIPDESTMREMIEDKICKVCGTKAPKGSKPHRFMVAKLNELLNSHQPKIEHDEDRLFKNNYAKELEQKSISLGYNQEELNKLPSLILGNIEFNKERKDDINKLQESINSEEDNKKKLLAQNNNLTEEQLQNAYENITNWYENRNEAEKQILLLEAEEGSLLNELQDTKDEYDKLAKSSVANTYCKIHTAFTKIQNAFKHAKEKNTRDFLNLLEDKANKYLEKLNVDGFHGIIRILKTPEGKARIVLQDKNDTFISNPNQALRTTMYMSVLFAISELTTIKRENDYPLVFDAPTSSFAPQKETDFFKVISAIQKQCIIFTKSFLTDSGTLDSEKINSLNCTIYRMKKKIPFDKHDLTTIQTELTLIKE